MLIYSTQRVMIVRFAAAADAAFWYYINRYAERDVKNRRHHQEEFSLFEFAASSSVSIIAAFFLFWYPKRIADVQSFIQIPAHIVVNRIRKWLYARKVYTWHFNLENLNKTSDSRLYSNISADLTIRKSIWIMHKHPKDNTREIPAVYSSTILYTDDHPAY